MVWQHSLWNVDKRITGWDGAFGAHFAPRRRKAALAMHGKQSSPTAQRGSSSTDGWRRANQGNSCLVQPLVGLRFKLRSAHARSHTCTKKEASRVKENPVRCEHPTNCPGERGCVRASEREGRREGWRREKELLSDYYPSVTGLLGSCYGYGDSRLSVLLTIANKASIQLWATMQISSLSLNLLLFTSAYIFPSSCSFASFTNTPPPPTNTHTPAVKSSYLSFSFVLYFLRHTATSITTGERSGPGNSADICAGQDPPDPSSATTFSSQQFWTFSKSVNDL